MSEKRFYKDSEIDGHPIVDRKTRRIYTSGYKRELVSLLNQLAELADRATPIEYGKNRYGVDVAYFRKTINRELNRPLTDFRPDELARVFARLSKTADENVLKEPEFTRGAFDDSNSPICHMRPMEFEMGEDSSWWTCSHCGHEKEA